MDRFTKSTAFAGGLAGLSTPAGMVTQPSLYPKRVSTVYPSAPNGADIAFMCEVAEGGTYCCKADVGNRSVRLTEWICTRLAQHLGIATAECAVVENDRGETFFGSRHHRSTLDEFRLGNFLMQPHRGELGQPVEWPGRYFSSLYALDLFLGNPDRERTNFVLVAEGTALRLCAIDFAAARLTDLSSNHFPIAPSRTVLVGKVLRDLHGFYEDSALEMIERIGAVPAKVVESFFEEIPGDWSNESQREGICEEWSSKRVDNRLAALRAGIRNGSLL